jgi:hypothetical protein
MRSNVCKWLVPFLGFAASLLLPEAGAAQPEYFYSGEFYCESFLTYDSDADEVVGYSRTEDLDEEGWPVSVDAQLFTPWGGDTPADDSGMQWDYDEVEGDVATSDASYWPGSYTINGRHYYGDSSDDPSAYYLGETGNYYDLAPPDYPWYEITELGNGYAVNQYFDITLVPFYDWPGTVSENFTAFDDGCYDLAKPLNEALYQVTEPSPGTSTLNPGGTFFDHVSIASAAWSTYYNGMISNRTLRDSNDNPVSSCGWYVNITDSYAYDLEYYDYYSFQDGMWNDGTYLVTYRDGVDSDADQTYYP